MNTILCLLIIIVMGLFSFITFILAEHKKEIYENIIFGDEDANL